MANRYWVGGSGNWSDGTNHWSTTSGGAPGAAMPTATDDVFIDANSGVSGATISLDPAYWAAECHNFTSTSGVSYTMSYVNSDFSIFGNATFESGITWDGVWIYFAAKDTGHTITCNGNVFRYIAFGDQQGTGNGDGGGWTLMDDMVINTTFYSEAGNFDANDHNITASNFYLSPYGTQATTISMGSGIWNATKTSSGGIFEIYNGTYLTLNAETSTIKYDQTSNNYSYIDPSGKTLYNLDLKKTGTGYFIIYSTNTWNEVRVRTPSPELRLHAGQTQTMNRFIAEGSSSQFLLLKSTSDGSQSTISISSGIVNVDWMLVRDIVVSGGATFHMGGHSISLQNNSGWTSDNSSYTPDAGGGADGYVYNDDSNYATCRGSASGDNWNTGFNRPYCECGWTGAVYRITRGFLAFDTSGLADDLKIEAAFILCNWTAGSWADTGNGAGRALVAGTQASVSTLANSDFSQVGSTRLASNDIPYTASGYQVFKLNAAGIANINKAGSSKFALRTVWDVDNLTPTGWNSSQIDGIELGSQWSARLVIMATGIHDLIQIGSIPIPR